MNIGTLTVTLGADASGLSRAAIAMQNFEKNTVNSINTISQRFRTFGYLASATVTAPIILAGKSAMNMAKEFEFSMQKIVGLTGVAQSSVDAWSDSILRMSSQVAKKPQELAEALYFISSSGIKGAEALNVLELSAKAATAGMGTTQDMAQVLTSALNAYRGTGLTAAYATDVLVAAVREGKAEAAGFSTSLGQIIPIAANLGLSFDQVAGGMAAITLTGASAANAAVYLKGVMNSLITASPQGEKALNAVGSSYNELRRILATGPNGLVNLMQRLIDIQKQYGEEALSDVMPNIRAITGVMSFAGKNFQYNTELMQRVTASTGTMGKAFAAVADTIKVRYDRAISAANVSLIELGKQVATAVLPILEKLVAGLERLTKWFDSLTEAEKRNKLILVAVVAALGPLSLGISLIGYTLSGLISILGLVGKAWGLFNLQLITTKTIEMGTVYSIGKYTISLATLRSTALSAGAALGKFTLGALGIGVVINAAWPLIQKLIDKIKSLKDQITEAKAVLEYSDDSMKLSESIGKRMSIINTLSQEGLQTLAGDISKRRQLEEERLASSVAIGKKEIENESQVLQWKKEIAEQEQILSNAIKTRGYSGREVDEWTKNTKYYTEERKQLISDYIRDRQKEVEYDKTSAQTTIDFYKKQEEIVNALITKQTALSDSVKTTTEAIRIQQSVLKASFDNIKLEGISGLRGKEGLAGGPIIPDDVDKANRALMRQQNILNSLTNTLANMFLSMEDGISGMINTLLDGIKRAVAMVAAKAAILGLITILFPGTAFGARALTMLKNPFALLGIPEYANGTNYAKGGLSLVGERGPELVNLPRGAQVIPGKLSGLDKTTNITVNGEIVGKGRDFAVILRRAGQYN